VDIRPNTTGLKHQSFVRWGIEEYDSVSKKYIKSTNGTEFNNMHKMPLKDMLWYNAIDSLLTWNLYVEQEEEIDSTKAYEIFNNGLIALNDMYIHGINIDLDYFKSIEKDLDKKIKEYEEEILESQEVIRLLNRSSITDFNLGSIVHLRALFFGEKKDGGLELESLKSTKTGESVDAWTLERLNHWIAETIIKRRKLIKVKDTYIAQFKNTSINGRCHPEFLLHIARSLRSSCVAPNFQNQPKRNKESKKIVRRGIKPDKGHRLVEIDFSGAEVTTSAAYHKDPYFIECIDPKKDTDMHRDNATDIWMLDPEEVTKNIRFYAKNCWTFPQFYGDYYGSCATSLWEHRHLKTNSGIPLIDHLKTKKITTYKQFEKHCSSCETRMWKDRFKVYDSWKSRNIEKYKKEMKIKTFLGFVFRGYLDKKQINNYPIQGTSFHLLLYAIYELHTWLKENNMETKCLGEVHDSVVLTSPEHEYKIVIKKFMEITRKLHIVFPWMSSPMEAEADISKIDGNFYEMEKYEGE